MDIDILQPFAFGKLDKREQMLGVTMDAAVRKQSVGMQRAAVSFNVVDGGEKALVLKKIAVLDRLGDARQLLIDRSSRADIEVSHLAVAHLPARKTDVHPRRAQRRVRIFCHKGLKKGRAARGDRVARGLFGDTEAVHND